MQNVFQDLRYATRMLLKQRGFTLVAIITLALGIGANTAIFSVVNSVFWQRLPYSKPDQLVLVWETLPKVGLTENTPAPINYSAWRDRSSSFEKLAAWKIELCNFTGDGEPEQIAGQRVSSDFFPMLGVQPALGRWFAPEEDVPGANVVVLSHELWQRRFGGDPQILGRRINLDNVNHEVIGVMPRFYQDPIPTAEYQAQFWIPLALGSKARSHSRSLFVIGQLKPDVSFQSAQSEVSTLTKQVQAEDPSVGTEFGVNVQPLVAQRAGRVRHALWILLAAAGFVLLIACVNVANLLLARAASRWKETATRSALGAGRWRLTRQFLMESLLLSVTGGLAGLIVSYWGVSLLVAQMPEELVAAQVVSIDWRVLSFTLVISLLTGLSCGLAPAIQAFRPNLIEALKKGGRQSTQGTGRLRSGLVIAQVSLTLILLIGAGLLLSSFWRLNRVGMGFDHNNLLTLRLVLPDAKYTDTAKGRAVFDQLLPRLNALAGVEAAGAISGLPVSFQGGGARFEIEGRAAPQNTTPMTNYRIVSSDYFRTLAIPIRSGRGFTSMDQAGTEPVAVISEHLARASWPHESPIGKRVRWGLGDGPFMTIVGVVGDVKLHQLSETKPQLYMPYSQAPFMPYEIAVRTTGDPLNLVPAVRREVWSVDKDLPIARVQTMDQLLSGSLTRQRFNVLLLGIFAALALTLAAVGIYGVMSYLVTQHTREIGIRMALGAQAVHVLKLIIGQSLTLSVLGVSLGVVGAFVVTRFIKSLLFEVSATDPLTFIVGPLLLLLVALVACYFPARRASKVDPLVALRYE